MATLRCRPSESEREPIMVFMSAPQMLSLKLKNGDLCSITWKDQVATAVAWLTMKPDLKEGVIGVSRWLQDRHSIKLENKVIVDKVCDTLQDADSIPIQPVEGKLDGEQRVAWTYAAQGSILDGFRYMIPSQRFFAVINKEKKEFEVQASQGAGIYKVSKDIQVDIRNSTHVVGDISHANITFNDVGGLTSQKALLKDILYVMQDSGIVPDFFRRERKHARGVLIWGPAGVGKTLLRQAIESEIQWAAVHDWDANMKKVPLSTGFQLVHVEFLTKLNDQEAKTLRGLFQSASSSTLILGEIHDPNDLPSFLRNQDTFTKEIEIPVPDASARLEILSAIVHNTFDQTLLRSAAAMTHGFVGGDLKKLLDDILEQLLHELVEARNCHEPIIADRSPVLPNMQHLELARTRIRPSALQQIFFEKPNIKWSDIGGQEGIKERLRTAVTWAIKYADIMPEYGISPLKGILLYGAPGCSKTMLVQALATESDYNFLAVKGAELVSMYVGESERATREIFRKARAASPCIIFFDEIDAIARRATGSSELNVLTTLLNEMDGFVKLRGVFVVAATNKPQAIDPALMRPGRFDNVAYIAPPDASARAAIFAEKFRTIKRLHDNVAGEMQEYVKRTEGFSGADVVAACSLAGEIALKRANSHNDPESEIALVGKDDVFEAIDKTPKSISPEMLEEYEAWNAQREL